MINKEINRGSEWNARHIMNANSFNNSEMIQKIISKLKNKMFVKYYQGNSPKF